MNWKGKTVEEVHSYLRENWGKGVDCPCCGHFVKMYKRRVSAGQALFLIGLYRLEKKTRKSIHKNVEVMKEVGMNTRGLDYSIAKYFGLMQEVDMGEDQDTRRTGYWELTDYGRAFVQGRIRIPKYKIFYNGKVMKKESADLPKETMNISEALGKSFSYSELMAEVNFQ